MLARHLNTRFWTSKPERASWNQQWRPVSDKLDWRRLGRLNCHIQGSPAEIRGDFVRMCASACRASSSPIRTRSMFLHRPYRWRTLELDAEAAITSRANESHRIFKRKVFLVREVLQRDPAGLERLNARCEHGAIVTTN